MKIDIGDANNTMKWINREINCSINNIKGMQRYQKARDEGYLNALKKVQARLDGKIKVVRMNSNSQYCPSCMAGKGMVRWIKEGCLNNCPNKDDFQIREVRL